MKLQPGTYLRERDGALHVYHSPLTTWNFPHDALRGFKENEPYSRIHPWRQVNDDQELVELKRYIGNNLSVGEYIEIQPVELFDWEERYEHDRP